MAVTLSAPPYSFVQITEPERATGCVDEFNLCLPIKALSDLSFQLIANVPKADEPWFEVEFDEAGDTMKHTIWGMICVACDNTGEFGPTSFSFTGRWRQIAEGGSGADTWLGNFTFNGQEELFNELVSGGCFNICFYRVKINVLDLTEVVGVTTALIACTDTCFQKIDDDCYTSFFTYNNKEDSMGFVYTHPITGAVNFANQVRLPCFLRDIQFPTEEKSYKKSNGDRVKLFARIDEEYELKVDWVYKSWHKRIVVLLHHDTIRIDNDNDGSLSNMHITCDEKYEINWPEEPYQLAPAKTKVKRAAGINIVNSNCQ